MGCFMLSYEELESILPVAKELKYRDYWEIFSQETLKQSDYDFNQQSRQQQVMRKARATGEAFGFDVLFPWCDDAVIDYYFNLPEDAKFNKEIGQNKVLVRQMLKDVLDYDAAQVGKHVFRFEGELFLNTHRKWVEEQILECDLWKQRGTRDAVEKLLAKLYKEMNGGMRAKNSIIGLLQVSGWVNHSRYLKS